jgi:uncharacterized protein YciI
MKESLMNQPSTNHYVYVFDPIRPELVTDPDAWTVDDERIGKRHAMYLKQAAEAGTVLLAGRSLDGIGPAVVILEADSEIEARKFMEADPFVAEGLMRAHLHPFRAAFVRS